MVCTKLPEVRHVLPKQFSSEHLGGRRSDLCLVALSFPRKRKVASLGSLWRLTRWWLWAAEVAHPNVLGTCMAWARVVFRAWRGPMGSRLLVSFCISPLLHANDGCQQHARSRAFPLNCQGSAAKSALVVMLSCSLQRPLETIHLEGQVKWRELVAGIH